MRERWPKLLRSSAASQRALRNCSGFLGIGCLIGSLLRTVHFLAPKKEPRSRVRARGKKANCSGRITASRLFRHARRTQRIRIHSLLIEVVAELRAEP